MFVELECLDSGHRIQHSMSVVQMITESVPSSLLYTVPNYEDVEQKQWFAFQKTLLKCIEFKTSYIAIGQQISRSGITLT